MGTKGLSCRFTLSEGKFLLTEGTEKVQDNLWFYCIYDRFRVYFSDFFSGFSLLQQKPVGYLITNQTLILGRIKKGINRYVPGVTVDSIDVGYAGSDRKEYHLRISYTLNREDNTNIQDVTFV